MDNTKFIENEATYLEEGDLVYCAISTGDIMICVKESGIYNKISELIIEGTNAYYYNFVFISISTFKDVYKEYNRTLCYNNRIGAFVGDYSFTPNIYININKELLTNDVKSFTDNIYLHNRKDSNVLTYYGKEYPMRISFITNGIKDSLMLNKQFLGHDIESSNVNFSRITYNTEYQNSIHDWFVEQNNISLLPEYLEHRWKFPINVQTSTINDAYEEQSNMIGQWLKTTLEYNQAEEFIIKKILTHYSNSNS